MTGTTSSIRSSAHNGLTEIRNAGQARIKGFETDLVWAVTDGFTLSTSLSVARCQDHAELLRHDLRPTTLPAIRTARPSPIARIPLAPAGTFLQAPKGQELPVQPNSRPMPSAATSSRWAARSAHLQAAWVYQGSAWSDLRTAERELLGKQPAYSIVDFAAGIDNDSWGLELFVKNAFDERAEIARFAECSTFQPRHRSAELRTACAACSRTR